MVTEEKSGLQYEIFGLTIASSLTAARERFGIDCERARWGRGG
jgi:hypothetical protein